MGGEAPPITAIQNTQAHSEFLTTSIPKQKPRLHKNYLDPLVNEPPCLDFRSKFIKNFPKCSQGVQMLAEACERAWAGPKRSKRIQTGPNKDKLLRVWVCPKESKSFLCSLGFCFGIEVVKNSEWACVFCTVLIWGAKPPPRTAIQNTQAHSEFLTT